jgi:hypothetical protein
MIDCISDNIDNVEVLMRINRVCNQKCIFCFVDLDNKTNFTFDEVVNEVEKIKLNYQNKKIEFVIT